MLSGGMALKAQNVDDTFSIESKEDLITFADLVENNKSLNARLNADIDLEGGYWNTICETALYYNSYSNDYGYSGTFDGNGHVIKNFKVKSSTTADASAGLFGTVCGTIKNLGVENFTFEDGGKDIRAAAIVGQLITTGGKISNCYVKNATITPGEHVTGGIAGCVYDGTIENCYVVNSNINGSSGRYGHIVGDSRGDESSTDRPGTVTNCYSDNTPLISDRKGNLSSVENKSAEQFASGEIAYLLQGEQQTDIWGQNIDNGETVQTYPVFSDAKVYKLTSNSAIIYTNKQDYLSDYHCGENLFWHVDENNTLTIFGTGAMYDYDDSSKKAPWRDLKTQPTSLVLEEGMTSIGDYAFYNCSSFKGSLTIPNSVTSIGYYAFSDCSNFVCVYALASTAPELGDKTFNGINNTILIYDENNAISYESNGWFGYFSKKLKKDNENFLYIESTEDFMDYARISKETSNKFSVRLYADINLIGFEWTPFTMERDMVFDGNGHNIHIEQDWSGSESGSNFGLFHTYNYNVIKNLTMTGYVKANTSGNVGAITGSAYRTTISNVISYVEVTNIGSGRAGGLAGQFGGQHSGELYSLIENCAVYANVTGNVAGGIIGHGWSGNQYYDIKNVAYAGDVTGSERQAAVIAYHGNNSSATKCKFENIYYCEKDALGFVGGGGNNYDLGTDVAAMTAAQFASGEVAYLLQGEQATQVWGQNIDNGETVQAYPVFGGAKIYKTSCGDNYYYSNANVEHSFNDNGFCNTCGNCEPAVFEDNYYLISNAGNLVWFSKHVNNDNFSANAKLMNDIEMNAVQWTPIGTATAYNGTFDGQGHTINNLWHNTGVADGGREGLFTLIGSNGVVTNVTLNNATIWGSSPYGLNGTGGIAVRNEGCITNTMVTNSSIQQGAYEYLGGIAGWNKGSITNCAVINSTLTRRWGGANSGTMGGITQTNSGSVTNCYTYGCMFNNGNNLNSAIVAKENAAVNSYYYTTDNVADAAETAKTKAQFASGEVAYLLQGEQTTQIWGQNIDNGETVQTYPVISDAKVYKHTFNGVTLYSNHKTLKAGGKCGDNLYWNVIDYVLTIYGTGAMWDYNYGSNKAPWLNLNPTPKSLVLKEGITHIGDSAFSGCSGFTGSLTIPNSVTSIGEGAFSGCSSFTGDLTIGNSVKSIGDWAFAECTGFNGSLTIPNSVTAIGSSAFRDCSGFTGSLTIPNSVTAIGNDAFRNCSSFTGDLTIPNSVTAIKGFAFSGCSGFNGSLTIPNSVTTIGNAAFANCSGFNGSLTIPNSVTTIGNYAFADCEGFTGSLTIGNSVTAIGDYAFQHCSGFTDVYSFAVTAPTLGTDAFANINEHATLYYPVSSYQSYDKNGWFNYFSNRKAFNGKCGDNLYWYVDVNNTLTIFGTGAMYDYEFSGDNISPWRKLETAPTSLVLEDGITHIGNYAFRDCKGLSGSLTIPNSVTTIGNYAFCQCKGLSGSLTIPNNVTTIGNHAFYYCEGFTGSLTIPNNVTTIGNFAFDGCSGFTGSLTIPNSVTSIGNYAFGSCKFSGTLTIPNSVTTIGNGAFDSCKFSGTLTIPNSVTSIGEWAFFECSGFTGSLTIPNSVTSIEECTFYGCSGFTGSLTIPNSVTYIGNDAFKQCNGFSDVYSFAVTAPTLGTGAFANINENATLYYPVSSEQSYNDNGWFEYFPQHIGFNGKCGDNLYWYVDENNTLTIFGTGAMYNYADSGSDKAPWRSLYPKPTSLVLEEGITHIGNYAFYYCTGFNGDLTIPNSVTTIGEYAFQDCSGFTGSLTIPNSVTSIGNYAFKNCYGFTEVYSLAETAPALGTEAFPMFKDINPNTTLYYPTSGEQSYNAKGWFNYFSKSIGLDKCGDNLYWNVDDTNTLTIFGTGAMYDYEYSGDNISPWKKLETAPTSLVLEEGITHIGNSAFDSCFGFTGSLTIPNSVTSIGNYAFYDCKGFTGSLTIPNSVTSIGNYAFVRCYGFTGSLTIGNSVTNIGEGAFSMCSGFNGSLTIPNSVTNIGNAAFMNCSGFNGSLTIPNSVTNIGEGAFYGCSSFTDVYSFAVTAPTLGTDAFANINENATLYYPVSSYQSYDEKGWFNYFSKRFSFGKCGDNLYWIVNDNTLTIFGTGAMYDYNYYGSNISPWKNLGTAPTSLSLLLEEGVTHIGNYAFYQCSGFTGDLTIPNSVTSIGNSAFDNCFSFTGSLTIPNSITSIGNNAFRNCSGFNGSLTIGNSVRSIGNYAFYYCNGFTGSLTIPNSVTSIGERAFCSCSGFTEIFLYRDTNPTIGIFAFSGINAKVCAPVIWKSFSNIPEDKLVKMATFVGEQSAVSGQQSGWVFPEGMTEVSADDHVAINAPMVISGQQSAVSSQQSANSLSVKSFGLCGNGTTVNGRITIEDGGQLYCEIANGEVTVKKEILGYQQSAVSGQQSESESKWYTIASPLKDTIQITTNSSFLTPNSDLYRYDEPSYTWQNAKNSANNGFNTIDPGRGYLYANAENTTLEFTGMINTDDVTYNLTAKSDVLNGFHLVGNPFTHDIYLGEAITESQRIIFEFNDEYGDGWNRNALKLSFSNGTPDKIITMESGNSETETISVATGVTVRVSFMKGYSQEECSFTIKYDDGEIICDKYSNAGSLTNKVEGETLTTFTVKEGKDVLVNGYYTLTGEGAWAAEASTTEAIKPMQSILVKSLVDDYELKIYNTSRQPSAVSRQQSRNSNQQSAISQQSLCISVSNAKYSDRAFVVFDKGVGLDKMNHENENIPLLYIPMEDADYAIAMMDINVNEIPVNFETNVMGEYTISLRQENCEFDELYLLDKETDEKVNILEQDYTFIATSSENPERFILMKDAQGSQLEAHSHFAYINNDDIVIYNIEGDADIKIFDALGRCVYHGESSDETTRIANGYSSGIYMIQKVDDKGVNVQKIIL